MQINTYLFFNGNCAEAFKYYEKVLGGTILAMLTHGEAPAAAHVGPEHQNSIMHAHLVVENNALMGSDHCSEMFKQPQGFSVSLHFEDTAEAERVFHALADGGTVTMPIEETFWADRFGMCADRFGIDWMVNCAKPVQAWMHAEKTAVPA